MSCGNNIVYFRKKLNITQEALSEKLGVSRQTVSRWENDGAFPETEKLIELCDLFDCSMDLLLRGDAENSEADKTENVPEENTRIEKDNFDEKHPSRIYESATEPLSDEDKSKDDKKEKDKTPSVTLEEYNKHINRFSFFIALGVFLILFSLGLTFILIGLDLKTLVCISTLFGFVAVSVAIFIFFGIWHSDFSKSVLIKPIYPPEMIKKLKLYFNLSITGATFIIFMAIIFLFIAIPEGETTILREMVISGVFIFLIGISVFIYVFAGIQRSKLKNLKNNPIKASNKNLGDAICGIIMLSCTALFLLLGFIFHIWHPAWVIFPIGGVSCGIVSTIFGYKNKSCDE